MRVPLSKIEPYSQEILAIEEEVRAKELIHDAGVQMLLRTARATYNQNVFCSTTEQLRFILESEKKESLRKPDSFRPYGPEQLLNRGNLHLLTQMDGTPFKIDPNKIVTGMLILGSQNSGKSRFIIHLCKELMK